MLARLLTENADGIEAAWGTRANNNPIIVELFDGPVSPELIRTLLREYTSVLAEGDPAVARILPARTVLDASARRDPRCDAVAWIELLAVGRAVLEEFLVEIASGRMGACPSCTEDLLDDLEAAFHLVTHQRIQCLCETCLSLLEGRSCSLACA